MVGATVPALTASTVGKDPTHEAGEVGGGRILRWPTTSTGHARCGVGSPVEDVGESYDATTTAGVRPSEPGPRRPLNCNFG